MHEAMKLAKIKALKDLIKQMHVLENKSDDDEEPNAMKDEATGGLGKEVDEADMLADSKDKPKVGIMGKDVVDEEDIEPMDEVELEEKKNFMSRPLTKPAKGNTKSVMMSISMEPRKKKFGKM